MTKRTCRDHRLLGPLLLGLIFALPAALAAQQPAQEQHPAKTFTDVTVLAAPSMKDQASTGTCWDFATISMLE
ncbi:MAG TPA: hypothetical protein VMT77_00190, partial [Gemmatimonadales bacterium]|nr:hypothetical protein [Gemmatimonadales bacterium]